jgi:CheY-like chemotaxis protein
MTDAAPPRILVVDDSKDGADSLSVVLSLMGAEACAAYDGPSALELVGSFRPTVVLMDIGMPEMDGHEVARRIRADAGNAAIKLIALTGWGTDAERRRSEAAGFDEHWVKPVEPEKLKALVAGRTGGRR